MTRDDLLVETFESMHDALVSLTAAVVHLSGRLERLEDTLLKPRMLPPTGSLDPTRDEAA